MPHFKFTDQGFRPRGHRLHLPDPESAETEVRQGPGTHVLCQVLLRVARGADHHPGEHEGPGVHRH